MLELQITFEISELFSLTTSVTSAGGLCTAGVFSAEETRLEISRLRGLQEQCKQRMALLRTKAVEASAGVAMSPRSNLSTPVFVVEKEENDEEEQE